MRILFITPSPPNNLNRIRSKNIIISLTKLGHEVFLVSLIKNQKEQNDLELMSPYTKELVGIKQPIWLSLIQCIFGLILPKPLRVIYCYSYKLRKELKKKKYQNFDFIYIKRLRMAQYASLFNKKNKILIDLTDSMIKYYQRLKENSKGLISKEEYFKHKIYEPKICQKYNTIICSEDDKKYLVDKFGCNKDKIKILENGVNLNEWSCRQKLIKKNLYNLVFWGVMNVETNILSCKFFIKKVMPLLNDKFNLSIIGPKPGQELTRYRSPNISFEGYVENMCKALSDKGIFVCPIISGAGVKNKIIQASSIGMPVISTSLGVEGINSKLKKHIFIANTPREFVNKINLVVNIDKESLKNLQIQQIKAAKECYDVYDIVKKFSNKFLI